MDMVDEEAEAVTRHLHHLQTKELKIFVAFTAIVDDGLLLVDGGELERRSTGMQWWSSFLAHIEGGDLIDYCNGLQVVLRNLKGAGFATSLHCSSFW